MKMAYSLWLVPDEPEATLLSDVICDLGMRYLTTPFPPHVTLLGGLTCDESTFLQNTEMLVAARATAMQLQFTGVDAGPTAYQCVFAMVYPSVPLVALHSAAQQLFGVQGNYMPHLSLVYSKGMDRGIREKIVEETQGLVKEMVAITSTRLQAWATPLSEQSKWELLQEWELPAPAV